MGKLLILQVVKRQNLLMLADGLAIAVWTKNLEKKAAIITGRNSSIVERRAKELNNSFTSRN